MSQPPFLEIQIHLSNGNKHRFAQADENLARQTLQGIGSNLFSQPTLVLYSQNTVAAYPTSAVTGVHLKMASLPIELARLTSHPATGVEEVREVSYDDFQTAQKQGRPIVAGEPFVLLSEVELSSTHRIRLQARIRSAASGMQERRIVQGMFSGPALACLSLEGGLSLWNRSQFVSYTFSPAPDVPATAWPAELVST